MADEKPKKVTVEALRFHSTAGSEYQVGDTYEVEEGAVENLASLGMAVRVDRVDVAKAAAKAAAKPAKLEKPAKAAKTKKGRK